MSPPLIGIGDVKVEEEGKKSNVTNLLVSSELKERNYMGLSDSSSVDSSVLSFSDETKTAKNNNLNLKATELRLGLPGSQSPDGDQDRDSDLCLRTSAAAQFNEKPLFPLRPLTDDHHSPAATTTMAKTAVLGSKRGFSDAMNGFSEGKFLANSEVNAVMSPRPSHHNMGLKTGSMLESIGAAQPAKAKEVGPVAKAALERPHAAAVNENNRTNLEASANNNNANAPAPKAQVVGWPPIRSFRKNSLATSSSKNAEEVDGKAASSGALFIKVSMDGAPYLRKVDLKNYSAYPELSSALEKMFSCFTIGQCGSHGALGREILNETKLKDMLHGSEYVLTYEDKDGDWMLVGDVPWEMFIDTCRRLRIMKGSDAIGLAPRAVEKSKSRN